MLMATSGLLSAVGLYWLGSGAVGVAIFIAFAIYAVGQTYYWPCILGFVSERFPKGGALTLNTVSALALLSLGMIGNPVLGVARDKSVYSRSQEQMPEVLEVAKGSSDYLWMINDVLVPDRIDLYGAKQVKADSEAIIAGLAPIVSGNEELKKAHEELKAGLAKKAEGVDFKKDLAGLGISTKDIEALRTYKLVSDSKDEEIKTKVDESLSDSAKAKYKTYTDAVAKHTEIQTAAGRDVLKFAAYFPSILVISFIIIALYFRSIGGYKPIVLTKTGADGGDGGGSGGADAGANDTGGDAPRT